MLNVSSSNLTDQVEWKDGENSALGTDFIEKNNWSVQLNLKM